MVRQFLMQAYEAPELLSAFVNMQEGLVAGLMRPMQTEERHQPHRLGRNDTSVLEKKHHREKAIYTVHRIMLAA